ncbi:hypothetical protein BKA93DRAFT_128144 [Sparassis latifolia]
MFRVHQHSLACYPRALFDIINMFNPATPPSLGAVSKETINFVRSLLSDDEHIQSAAFATGYREKLQRRGEVSWGSSQQGVLVLGYTIKAHDRWSPNPQTILLENYWLRFISQRDVWYYQVHIGLKYRREVPLYHWFLSSTEKYIFLLADEADANRLYGGISDVLRTTLSASRNKPLPPIPRYRISQQTISGPKNFQRLAHLGYDEQGRTKIVGNIPRHWQTQFHDMQGRVIMQQPTLGL